MHIPRFFLMPEDVRALPGQPVLNFADKALDLQEGARLDIVNANVANQVRNVLRLRAGDKLLLLNGCHVLYESLLEQVEPRQLRCLVEKRVNLPQDNLQVCVALALLKGERFDWALQKMTELGVAEIVPLITSRSVVKIDTFDAKGTQAKLTRWRAIVREASEQSERTTIPQLVAPQKFEAWIAAISSGGTRDTAFICAERIPGGHLRDILLQSEEAAENVLATTGKTIQLIVGPEGGFTSEEIESARKQGIKPISLGQRILRSETAAIYALSQVIWCLEK